MEADAGHYVGFLGASFVASTDDFNCLGYPNGFRRAGSVQAAADWLFGREIFMLQI